MAGIAVTAFGLRDVRAFNYTMIRSGIVIGAVGFVTFITAKLLAWWRTG